MKKIISNSIRIILLMLAFIVCGICGVTIGEITVTASEYLLKLPIPQIFQYISMVMVYVVICIVVIFAGSVITMIVKFIVDHMG